MSADNMNYRKEWQELRNIETDNNDGMCVECDSPERDCDCEPVFKVFEYGGVSITNPYLSECGRFEVDPFEYYGLTEQDQI